MSTTVAADLPLIRAIAPESYELRDDGDGSPVMHGHFAVFNRWTEIDSWFEGRFLERIAPGAFKKTFAENRDSIKVLFQHGYDPQIGDKPLGRIDVLEEDSDGARYEVPLLDASYVRDQVLPGLRAGLYGASFRFKIMKEEFEDEPEPRDDNPQGLPERTIKEARLFEFGPVTFPAYEDATAGVRSLTDEFALRAIARNDPKRLTELRKMLETNGAAALAAEPDEEKPAEPATSESTPDQASRSTQPRHDYLRTGKERPSWLL